MRLWPGCRPVPPAVAPVRAAATQDGSRCDGSPRSPQSGTRAGLRRQPPTDLRVGLPGSARTTSSLLRFRSADGVLDRGPRSGVREQQVKLHDAVVVNRKYRETVGFLDGPIGEQDRHRSGYRDDAALALNGKVNRDRLRDAVEG